MKDARVSSAISHWAPRFVSNGVLLADFEEVTASLERWEDWCAAWSARAKLHEDLAKESLSSGFRLTAGEHFVRAAMYYHFAKFVFVQDPAQMRDYAKEISKAVTYLTSVAQRLTQYARPGQLDKTASAGVHLGDLLDQAVTMAKYSSLNNEIEVVKEYGATPLIRANSGELLQIFVNLITNACHAMERGELTDCGIGFGEVLPDELQ
jgi:signal transduction histidine kinase